EAGPNSQDLHNNTLVNKHQRRGCRKSLREREREREREEKRREDMGGSAGSSPGSRCNWGLNSTAVIYIWPCSSPCYVWLLHCSPSLRLLTLRSAGDPLCLHP